MLVRAGDIPTITITNKTNPKIAELYQKLQDKSAEIAGIESERLGALEENATAMYEKEQSLENKTLTATTTAATGLGAMEAARAIAEKIADNDAEEKMSEYITTMKCEYGGGTQVNLGKQETLPGGNELLKYYAEYKQLAEKLKATKKALNLRPGIESEILYDRAESGIYRYQTAEQQSGAYTSLSRALMNPEGEDAAKIATQKQENSEKLKTGLIAAGGGIVAGIIGNYEINKDAPKESSDKINQEYDDKVSKVNKEKTDIETELTEAIEENAKLVAEYNAKIEKLKLGLPAIKEAPGDCLKLVEEYVSAVDDLELIKNETDLVPDVIMPEMDSGLLEQCKKCKSKDKEAIFDSGTGECKCPAAKPVDNGATCVEKTAEVVAIESPGDDEVKVSAQKKDEQVEDDDPNICAVGLEHTAGFGIVAGQTRVGDTCTSKLVLYGIVFKRKNGTCGCSARQCETRNGRAPDAVGGVCVCDESNGYKEENKKCVCDTEKGYKNVDGKCVKSTNGNKTDTPKKEYKYYNCGDERQLPKGINKENCKYITDFSNYKVTPLEAEGLMKEWALKKYKDTIECDTELHRNQADSNNYRQCASISGKEWYEFKFKDLDAGNKDFFAALCSIWGLKYGKSDDGKYYACKDSEPYECKDISDAVKRTFFPGGEAVFENPKCVIKVHESAQSSRYQINAKATTIDKLKTTDGIDPRRFYDKGFQVNATGAYLYKSIQQYLFTELGLLRRPMQCFSGIVDNVLVIPMTTDEYEATRKKQNECVSQNNTAMMGSSWGGGGAGAYECMKKYPIPEEMSDILTCEYDGKRFDLTFKKLDVKWDKKSIGGYERLECYNQKGEPDDKSCALLCDPKKEDCVAQCTTMSNEFKKNFPGSKGMRWDDELGVCALLDAKDVARVQKGGKVAGMVVLTLVTSVTGGPIMWAVASLEASALYVEAKAEDELSKWATEFLRDAQKCTEANATCAENVLRKHSARMIDGAEYFTDTQKNSVGRQLGRMLSFLGSEGVNKIVEYAETKGYFIEDKDPNWTVLKAYYGTQLTQSEKNLLKTKKIATAATFATLFAGGIMAGLRQSFKHNWFKLGNLSKAKQAKWIDFRILRKEDVAEDVYAMSKLGKKAAAKAGKVAPVALDISGDAAKAGKGGTKTDDVAKTMERSQAKKLTELDEKIAELESETNLTSTQSQELSKLRAERNRIRNQVGIKDPDELARAQKVAYNPELEEAQSDYQKLLSEREGYIRSTNDGKTPSRPVLQDIDRRIANQEKKLKDLGADVEPVEPLWKADGKTTTPKKTEPKPAEPTTTPKEPETVAPKSVPAQKATGGDPYTNMDPRLKAKIDQIKTDGGELLVAKKNLTDDQWKALKENLAKDGVEVKEQGSAMFVIKKAKATQPTTPKASTKPSTNGGSTPTIKPTNQTANISDLAKKDTGTIIRESKNLNMNQQQELYSKLSATQKQSIAKLKVDAGEVKLPFGSNVDDLAKNPDLLSITGDYMPLSQKAITTMNTDPKLKRFSELADKVRREDDLINEKGLIEAKKKNNIPLTAEESKKLQEVNSRLDNGARLTEAETKEYNNLVEIIDPNLKDLRHVLSNDMNMDDLIANGMQYKEKLLEIIASDEDLARAARNFDKLPMKNKENFMNQIVKKLDASFGGGDANFTTNVKVKYIKSWADIEEDARYDLRMLGMAKHNDNGTHIIYILNNSPVDLGYGNQLDNSMGVFAHEYGHVMDAEHAEKVAIGSNSYAGRILSVDDTSDWVGYAEYIVEPTERSSRAVNEIVGTNFTTDLNKTIKSGKISTTPVSDLQKLKVQTGYTGKTFVRSPKETNKLGVDYYKFAPEVERSGSLESVVDNIKETGIEHVAVIKEDGKDVVAIFDNADDYNAAMKKLNTQAPKGAPKATANVENSVRVGNTGRGAANGASSAGNTAKKTGDVADAARNSDKADDIADMSKMGKAGKWADATVPDPTFDIKVTPLELGGKKYYLKSGDTESLIQNEISRTKQAHELLKHNKIVTSVDVVEDDQTVVKAFMDAHPEITLPRTPDTQYFIMDATHANTVEGLSDAEILGYLRNKPITIEEQNIILSELQNMNNNGLIHNDIWHNFAIYRDSGGDLHMELMDFGDFTSEEKLIRSNDDVLEIKKLFSRWSDRGLVEKPAAPKKDIASGFNMGEPSVKPEANTGKTVNKMDMLGSKRAPFMTANRAERKNVAQIKKDVAPGMPDGYFDAALKRFKKDGQSVVFDSNLTTDEGWELLNKSIKEENIQLVDDGFGNKVFRRARNDVADKVGGNSDVYLDPNELVRFVGNEGKEINSVYIKNAKEARQYLDNAINSGKYTRSLDDYIETMNDGHRISAMGLNGDADYYAAIGKDSSKVHPGQIRTAPNRMSNNYEDKAFQFEQIAKQYGDPYRTTGLAQIELPGIPKDNLPYNSGTSHYYPGGGEALRPYYKQMHRTAKEALDLIDSGASERAILEKIAEHYNYAIAARPYGQINNSLFMNEVNALLRKAGLKTMPQGELDFAAMYLQPNTFKKYFIDTYYKTRL